MDWYYLFWYDGFDTFYDHQGEVVHSEVEPGDSREQGALAVWSESAAVLVAEADEGQHKMVSGLELAGDEHCAGAKL